MDLNIKASFIPDKVVSTARGGAIDRSSGGISDILFLIAIVILVTSLALAAGVFSYDTFLNTSIKQQNVKLKKSYGAFEPSLIQNLTRVDKRINASTMILNQHMAPSVLFSVLEKLTLKSISYKSLTYSVDDTGLIKIELKGEAKSVNGVALQASVFGKYKGIKDPIFSNINIKNDGVVFDFSATLDPSYVSYQTMIQQEQTAQQTSDTFTSVPVQKGASTESGATSGGVFGTTTKGVSPNSTQ